MRQAAGSLLWLPAMMRPAITDAVRAVARYANTPTERLWQVILKILSCRNGTKGFGITYVRRSSLGLEVYTDADYAGKANDRRSMSGIAVILEGTIVSHASQTSACRVVVDLRGRILCGWGRGQGSFVCACRSVFHYAQDERGKH